MFGIKLAVTLLRPSLKFLEFIFCANAWNNRRTSFTNFPPIIPTSRLALHNCHHWLPVPDPGMIWQQLTDLWQPLVVQKKITSLICCEFDLKLPMCLSKLLSTKKRYLETMFLGASTRFKSSIKRWVVYISPAAKSRQGTNVSCRMLLYNKYLGLLGGDPYCTKNCFYPVLKMAFKSVNLFPVQTLIHPWIPLDAFFPSMLLLLVTYQLINSLEAFQVFKETAFVDGESSYFWEKQILYC